MSAEEIFTCPQDELPAKLAEKNFPVKAMSYHVVLAMPPEKKQTKGGIILPGQVSEMEQFRSSVGRVISLGGTVGNSEALKDLRELQIGDYVSYHYYAAGTPFDLDDMKIKIIADDMVKATVSKAEAIKKLYD